MKVWFMRPSENQAKADYQTIHRKRTKNLRSQFGGAFLIELLIAILISALFGAALVAGMSDSLRVTTKSQNQVLATSIAQQVLDSCRNRDFNLLLTPPPMGCMALNQQLVVNGADGSNYPVIFPRALVMDLSSAAGTHWDDRSVRNGFRGRVLADVVRLDNDTAEVTVTVRWNEPGTTAERTTRMTSRITRYGIRSS